MSLATDIKNGLKRSRFNNKTVQLFLQPSSNSYQLLCLSAFLSQQIRNHLCAKVNQNSGEREKIWKEICTLSSPAADSALNRVNFFGQSLKESIFTHNHEMPVTSGAFQGAPCFSFLNGVLFHGLKILEKITQRTHQQRIQI